MEKWVWFYSVFPFKPPIYEHISEISFDRKCNTYPYFCNGESNRVCRFSINPPNIWENRIKMNFYVNFRIKVLKKWHARKSIGWNSRSIKLTEKWKISLDVLLLQLTCIQFAPTFVKKISFKWAIENFASVGVHMRTALDLFTNLAVTIYIPT